MVNKSTIEYTDHSQIPVIDYEGSNYKQAFWEGQGREYEDLVERTVLEQLLPSKGTRIVEVGAGFGRLAELYTGYQQIILFDYSRSLLAQAAAKWGNDERFIFIAGNLYDLPLTTGSLDTLVMPRVMHHLADVPTALRQIERVLHHKSVAILEYANKRNLKAIGRWFFRRQSWSPFAAEPVEFVPLNFDFHPRWMNDRLSEAGLLVEKQLALSHFRLPLLKRTLSAKMLVGMEQPFFTLGGFFPLSPSVFVSVCSKQHRQKQVIEPNVSSIASILRCPNCTTEGLIQVAQNKVKCPDCDMAFGRQNQIWDFKEPLLQ